MVVLGLSTSERTETVMRYFVPEKDIIGTEPDGRAYVIAHGGTPIPYVKAERLGIIPPAPVEQGENQPAQDQLAEDAATEERAATNDQATQDQVTAGKPAQDQVTGIEPTGESAAPGSRQRKPRGKQKESHEKESHETGNSTQAS